MGNCLCCDRKPTKTTRILETCRTYLRELQNNDVDELSRIVQDSDYRKMSGDVLSRDTVLWMLRSTARNDVEAVYTLWTQRVVHFCIVEKNRENVIGFVQVTAISVTNLQWDASLQCSNDAVAFGYGIDKLYWGRGLMTEVIQALTHYVHTVLEIKDIFADVKVHNISCQRVLQKSGFTRIHQFYNHTKAKENNYEDDGDSNTFQYILFEHHRQFSDDSRDQIKIDSLIHLSLSTDPLIY